MAPLEVSEHQPTFIYQSAVKCQRKQLQAPSSSPRMRFAYILLVAAVALLSSGNVQAMEAEGESRLLRSHKTTVDDSIEEERGLDTLQKAVVKNLPDHFSKMYHSSTKMNNTFASWYQGLQSVDDAVTHMKSQGMEFDAIAYFVKRYREYIRANGGQPF